MRKFAAPGLLLLACLSTSTASADVSPAKLFAENMVIQQQTDAAIWGSADPGEAVTVSASWGESATTVADSNGEWLLTLQTPDAIPGSAHSYTLSFKGNNQIDFENVLVGEVWLASGQSNMDRTITSLDLSDEQVGDSNVPLIREYKVYRESWFPADDTMDRWKIASNASTGDFSATAWFFARHLHRALDIPIGIVNSSWGGKPIEAFFSREAQESHALTHAKVAELDGRMENQVSEDSDARRALLHRYPGSIYTRMIRPLQPYSLKGTIWYQGEANSNSAEAAIFYERQLTDLILNWRNDWHDAQMPFYVVQLASFRSPQVNPVEHDQYWPITRESIRKVTGNLDHTGMAVTIDIGTADDIHPRNKMEVGRRLALLALHNDYEHELVPSGPLFKSFTIEGGGVLLDFDHKGAGLVAQDSSQLSGFAIAGNDGEYVWAEANIVTRSNGRKLWQEQQFVQVQSPLVESPVSVKYGWADNPITINLYNEEGLPASPFSTD